jgi:hypothetical protein
MSIYVISPMLRPAHRSCVKTGRNQIWIWCWRSAIVGVIAYVAAELIPDLLRSPPTYGQGMKKALDPQADLRRLEGKARLTEASTPTSAWRRAAAQSAPRAIGLPAASRDCTTRPNLMLGLARRSCPWRPVAHAHADD